MRAGESGAKRRTDCYPTLGESISAAETLLKKISPDLKGLEIGGTADGVPVAVTAGEPLDMRETARRLALIFQRNDPALAEAEARAALRALAA